MSTFLDEIYNDVPKYLINYCNKNNITSINQIPICNSPECNNHVTYHKDPSCRGFLQYCSSECSRKNNNRNLNAEKLLSDKEWLYDQRFIKRKSLKSIGILCGVSEPTVKKWIEIYHKFPSINLVESELSIKQSLNDWELIDNLYNNKNLDMRSIAKELNSSSSSVQIAIKNLNIKPKQPNSYDKKFNKRSSGELEICEFLTSLNVNFLCNKKPVGEELDIYIPDKNLAIEYNGIYYHHEQFKCKLHHYNKTNNCEMNNIQLLHIFEDSWKENSDLIKSMIMNKLGLTPNKIYARKCNIKQISKEESRQFLIDNHLQGFIRSQLYFGLYYDDELVSLMTFNIPRFTKKYEYELVRFASKKYTNVIGGFSKLLSYFIKRYSNSIVSYADRTYSIGSVYENNGFIKTIVSKPSYWYVVDKIRVHRSMYRKAKLKQYDKSLSERQITDSIGIPRIYNSGTITYVYEGSKDRRI